MKTAWIFPGGAARGVYTAGALYALSKMNLEKPSILIAASSSAPTSICYITGQYEIIPKVWLESLSTTTFVSFWRFWKILNVGYLVDIVLREKNPLDMEKLRQSDICVYFPLTDSVTGEIAYFSNKMSVDFWQVVRAAVSVPVSSSLFSFKGSPVGGQFFSDSAPASLFQLHVKKALEEGADRIIVFDNWHKNDNPHWLAFSRIFYWLRNRKFRKNQLNYIQQVMNFSPPNMVEFIRLAPKEPLQMSRFEINNQNARKIFQRGYEDTFNNPALNSL